MDEMMECLNDEERIEKELRDYLENECKKDCEINEGKSFKYSKAEIAKKLDIPESTVRYTLKRMGV